MKETVNHPQHYNSLPATCDKCGENIECISVVRHLSFNLGNALKYIWRANYKENTVEDLRKAIWYLEDEIKQRERNERKISPLEKEITKKIKTFATREDD